MVRTEDEVQRAHDLLVGLLTGDMPEVIIDDETKTCLMVASDVLCWFLGHDHNTKFTENIQAIESLVAEAGYRFTKPS